MHNSNPKKQRVQQHGLSVFECIFKDEGFEETVIELEVFVCAERKCE